MLPEKAFHLVSALSGQLLPASLSPVILNYIPVPRSQVIHEQSAQVPAMQFRIHV